MKIPNPKSQIPKNSQAPNSKLQAPEKIQIPSSNVFGRLAGNLGFGIWSFIGVWDLGFGVS